jgi:predicted amidohydrolase
VIVAGIQFDIAWEDPTESFARVAPLIQQAVEEGARLIALPEMFATGFSMRSEAMADHASTIRTFLAGTASAYEVWVVAGFAEPGDARPANACSVYSPEGDEVLHYRKIHPFSLAHETEHFEAGDTLATVNVEGVRVTPLICYDLRFPEIFRAAAEATDLFVVIANWPSRRALAWRTLLAARAIDTQAWVLGVNRVGEAEGYPHRGDSSLLDPWGAVIATLVDQSGVVLNEVDAEVVRQARKRFPFLRDRRRDVYRRLEDDNE